MQLIASPDQANQIAIAGEASSHCVKATTEHIVENLPFDPLYSMIFGMWPGHRLSGLHPCQNV